MRQEERGQDASPVPTELDGPILVAGLGSIGCRHLQNLRALGHEDLILYRTGQGPPRRPEASTRREPEWVHELPSEASLDVALARSPAAVVVSNPTALHVETALSAARAGAHVLVEKPLSHSMQGVEELAREVRERDLVLLVGYQFRFHPTLGKVRNLVQNGAVGRPVSARAWWGEHLPDWHPGEQYTKSYAARRDLGGGAILTLSHPLDYLCWILGPVASVSCRADQISELEVEVEDVVEMVLRFESGTIGSLHLDYVRRPPDHGMEIVGTGGTVIWNAVDGVASIYRVEGNTGNHIDACSRVTEQRGLEEDEPYGSDGWTRMVPPKGFGRNDLFLAEMKHFLRCIVGEEEPQCTLEDGGRALLVALAAHESAREGTVRSV